MGRNHACGGISRTFREKAILGFGLQEQEGVCEGQGARGRGSSMSTRVAARSCKGHGERSRRIVEGGEDLPSPWPSRCVQLGTKKYVDLCWFYMTFDLSHN